MTFSHYNYPTSKKTYLDKISLDTKRGKPFVTTKGGIPIKIVWPNPHPSYHSMCG